MFCRAALNGDPARPSAENALAGDLPPAARGVSLAERGEFFMKKRASPAPSDATPAAGEGVFLKRGAAFLKRVASPTKKGASLLPRGASPMEKGASLLKKGASPAVKSASPMKKSSSLGAGDAPLFAKSSPLFKRDAPYIAKNRSFWPKTPLFARKPCSSPFRRAHCLNLPRQLPDGRRPRGRLEPARQRRRPGVK